MVGVNFFVHKIATVAIFATLFVAFYVNGEKTCLFDIKRENLESEYDLQCNDLKNAWTVIETDKKSINENKLALVLEPDHGGCLKTRNPVMLTPSSKFLVKFLQDGPLNGNVSIRLIPKEGSCSDEECLWKIKENQPGQWVTAYNSFPLISEKEYYIQLQVGKNSGKFVFDHMTIPGAESNSVKCTDSKVLSIKLADQLVATNGNSSSESGGGSGGGGGGGSGGAGFSEISKNLMLTSASVLTLNNLLN